MCCEPCGTEGEIVGFCAACGSNVDEDGCSDDICGYSTVECEVCGNAPCDESC